MQLFQMPPLKVSLTQVSLFVLSFVVVIWAYTPALSGGFLFDDYPNLQQMGVYGGVKDWDTFRAFVLDGIAGPLGRPVSLVTFLLDDITWPMNPADLKVTNLKIQLLCWLCLLWGSLNLLRLLGVEERKATIVALLSSGLWVIHPYMVSTNMYIIQRMTQMAALFMFAGIAGYLYGRILLLRGEVVKAYCWMSVSLGVGTILAAFSKENGILLPLMVLMIELCIANRLPTLALWWRCLFLYMPTAVVTFLLLKEVNFSENAWPDRNFNQVERLLTQPRIIWEYLYDLFIPKVETNGLFRDGYVLSKGLLTPWTTLPSLLGVLGLIGCGFVYRKKYPLIALAILLFFSSHLLESTLIGLELYFEHRSYIGAGFLFLPIVYGCSKAADKWKISWLVVAAVFLGLIFLTYTRATLWSNSDRLETYWAVAAKDSPRAYNRLAQLLVKEGRLEEATHKLQEGMNLLPRSGFLSINYLMVRLYGGELTNQDIEFVLKKLPNQEFDSQAILAMRKLVELCLSMSSVHTCNERMLGFLISIDGIKEHNSRDIYIKLSAYLKGMLSLSMNNSSQALGYFKNAIELYNETDAGLRMVSELALAGMTDEAYELLQLVKIIYQNQEKNKLKRTISVYEKEFQYLEENLKVGSNGIKDGAM